MARGYRGRGHSSYVVASAGSRRRCNTPIATRRTRKRQFRALWIQRINAAAREHGLTYSQLMHGLALAKVDIDRKVLADLAVREPAAFRSRRRAGAERARRDRLIGRRAIRGSAVGVGSLEDLHTLEERMLAGIETAGDLPALEQARVAALGKKSPLTQAMKGLGRLDIDARKEAGARLNQIKRRLRRCPRRAPRSAGTHRLGPAPCDRAGGCHLAAPPGGGRHHSPNQPGAG